MLKLYIAALALLCAQQISPMFIDLPYESADEKFARTNPKGKVLIDAASNGSIEQVKKLIHEGVDINTEDPYKNTALFYAAMNGHEELCKLLISKGAHTTCACDARPIWRVILATNSSNIVQNFNIAELLLNPHNLPTKKACSQAIITFLGCMKKNKQQNAITLLFSNHWKTLLKPHFVCRMRMASDDINQKNSFGETALMTVATNRNLIACEWLIAHGADVNKPCGIHTALSLARRHQQYYKRRLKKDPSSTNDYAVFSEICELLLAHGAIEDEGNQITRSK